MKSNSNIQGYCNQYAKAADLGIFEGLKMEKITLSNKLQAWRRSYSCLWLFL